MSSKEEELEGFLSLLVGHASADVERLEPNDVFTWNHEAERRVWASTRQWLKLLETQGRPLDDSVEAFYGMCLRDQELSATGLIQGSKENATEAIASTITEIGGLLDATMPYRLRSQFQVAFFVQSDGRGSWLGAGTGESIDFNGMVKNRFLAIGDAVDEKADRFAAVFLEGLSSKALSLPQFDSELAAEGLRLNRISPFLDIKQGELDDAEDAESRLAKSFPILVDLMDRRFIAAIAQDAESGDLATTKGDVLRALRGTQRTESALQTLIKVFDETRMGGLNADQRRLLGQFRDGWARVSDEDKLAAADSPVD